MVFINFNCFLVIFLSFLVLCVLGENQIKEELKAKEIIQSLSNTTALKLQHCNNQKPLKQCSLESHDCPSGQHCTVSLCGDTFCVANDVEELERNPNKYLPKTYGGWCLFSWQCKGFPLAICYICRCIP